jgi:peroxiredoxin family protein
LNLLIIISVKESETIYNAMRLANVVVAKGDDVTVFMLGGAVCYEQSTSAQFDVQGEINKFQGDFYV